MWRKSGLYNALGAVHSWDFRELLDEAEKEVDIVEVRWIWGMDQESSVFGLKSFIDSAELGSAC